MAFFFEPVLKRTQVVSSAASRAQVERSCKKFALVIVGGAA